MYVPCIRACLRERVSVCMYARIYDNSDIEIYELYKK
jgi:hypothetical protein